MKTTVEKNREQARKPGNLKPEIANKEKSTEKKEENSTVVLDIDKESFSQRPHGRTTEPMGPGHEPGTV